MKRIEVGMLVIVIRTKFPEFSADIGRIGRVCKIERDYREGEKSNPTGLWLAILDDEKDVNCKGEAMGFALSDLRPINPDSEPADEDFQEDLKRWLGKKVTA
jgi:hypothetical protein